MDDTQVANMALSSIGTRSTIASLAEDSPEAATVQLWYAQTRDGLLRDFPWNWARRQRNLAVFKSARGTRENPDGALPQPPLPWLYEYSWPSDCLNARYLLPTYEVGGTPPTPPLTSFGNELPIFGRTPAIKFLIAGDQDDAGNPLKVLLTNQQLASLIYTGRVTDPNVWDNNFIDAMIGRLAQRISFPLSGDKALTRMAIEAGVAAEGKAEAENGNENVSTSMWTPAWIDARGYIDTVDDSSLLYAGTDAQDIT